MHGRRLVEIIDTLGHRWYGRAIARFGKSGWQTTLELSGIAMHSRRFIWGVPLVLLVVGTTPLARAAPPARGITKLANQAFLNPADKNRIHDWAQHWSDELAAGDPATVARARAKLMEPLKAVQVGGVFRLEYAGVLLPPLQVIIGGVNPHSAFNATQVVGVVGTDRALEILCDIANDQSLGIRLCAAESFKTAVRQGAITPNEISRGLRRLGKAACREEHWLVLRRQFEAIYSVDSDVSRDVQLKILQRTTARMSDNPNGPSDLMRALYPALKFLRDGYIKLPRAKQGPFGKVLAPVLCRVCSVADGHWEKAQEDPEAKKIYGGAIQISETLLQVIHGRVQPDRNPPRTALDRAWREKDKPRFDRDRVKWQGILANPPYGGN